MKKIGIVSARFNHDITSKLVEGAQQRLIECGVQLESSDVVWVPGAVEVPLMVQQLAKRSYDAIIAFAAVIKGETGHYDFVCQQVSDGCATVSLKYDLPVIFGVLTTFTHEQALARVGGSKGHHGVESADAALEMIDLVRRYSLKMRDNSLI